MFMIFVRNNLFTIRHLIFSKQLSAPGCEEDAQPWGHFQNTNQTSVANILDAL